MAHALRLPQLSSDAAECFSVASSIRCHAHKAGFFVSFYRATACNATHGTAKAFMSVRPSVKCLDCDKTKETSATYLYHMKDHSS